MRCEDVIQRYLQEDGRIGAAARIHVLLCGRCRREIFALEDSFQNLRRTGPFEMQRDLSDLVMTQILAGGACPEHNVSNFKWLASGAVLLFSIGLVTYSDTFSWLKGQFGRELEIPVSIVFGVVISIYSALFIGSHLRFLKEQISIYSKKLPTRKA